VKGYPLESLAFSCEKLINIPKFKTHGFTVLTACLKNLFGLVVGMYKMKIHKDNFRPEDLSKVIVDIYEARKPDLNILDGILGLEGQGPGSSGIPKKMNLVAASSDGLSLDMVLSAMMKVGILDIVTNKEAIGRGLGADTLASIELLGDPLDTFIPAHFKLPKASALSKLPGWVKNILAVLLTMKPCAIVSRCKLCGLCVKNCPAQAISLREHKLIFDYSKCILCLCCQEICPHAAIDVKRGLLLKIMALKQ
jgi:ferredoxin